MKPSFKWSPELQRRNSSTVFKQTVKWLRMLKSQMICNFRNRHLCSRQKLFGFFYQPVLDVLLSSNNDLLTKMEALLDDYFEADNLAANDIPTVHFIADQLNLSPNYLSDMLRVQTGAKFVSLHIIKVSVLWKVVTESLL